MHKNHNTKSQSNYKTSRQKSPSIPHPPTSTSISSHSQSRIRQTPTPLKNTTLSSQIHNPHLVQHSQKLSLVHHSITTLDKISLKHPQFQPNTIKLLYLSNNFISDLQHLPQFCNLQTLSLSFNQIAKLSTLRYLSKLSKLSIVAFEGNPICRSCFYQAYVIGVTTATSTAQGNGNGGGGDGGCLRIFDKVNLMVGAGVVLRREGLRNWNVYEENMNQLILNYQRLVYLIGLWKKEAVHRIIRTSMSTLSQPQQHDLSNQTLTQHQSPDPTLPQQNPTITTTTLNKLAHTIQFYLQQAQTSLSTLPIKYLMNIQNVVYEDVCKMSLRRVQERGIGVRVGEDGDEGVLWEDGDQGRNGGEGKMNTHTRNQASQIQVYVGSMYQLLQKQHQKQTELHQKILQKYCPQSPQSPSSPSFCPSQLADISLTQELLLSTNTPKQKQTQYYEWKLLQKIFHKLKQHVADRFRVKWALMTMNRVVRNQVMELVMIGWARVRAWGKRKVLEGGFRGIWRVLGLGLMNGMRGIKEMAEFNRQRLQKQNARIQQSKQQQPQQQPPHLQQNGQFLLKTCFKYWQMFSRHQKTTKQNITLSLKLQQYELRETKLINKIQLLEKLLAVTEGRLEQKDQELTLIKRSIMGQGRNQPLYLIQQIQKQFPISHNYSTIRSPSQSSICSPRAIRKNHQHKQRSCSGQNKQNLQGNVQIVQRKFNGSKMLRIRQDR